jgi:hypothetical protein
LINAPDLRVVTVITRRGRVVAERRRRPLGFDRILPADPRTDAQHDLARIALDVVVRAVDPASLPSRWSTHAFAREVAEVRAQLAPIQSRRSLAESFAREAAVCATKTRSATDPPSPPGPVRVAYAIRWLELGDDRLRPSWESWIGQPMGLGAAQMNGEIST